VLYITELSAIDYTEFFRTNLISCLSLWLESREWYDCMLHSGCSCSV